MIRPCFDFGLAGVWFGQVALVDGGWGFVVGVTMPDESGLFAQGSFYRSAVAAEAAMRDELHGMLALRLLSFPDAESVR